VNGRLKAAPLAELWFCHDVEGKYFAPFARLRGDR